MSAAVGIHSPISVMGTKNVDEFGFWCAFQENTECKYEYSIRAAPLKTHIKLTKFIRNRLVNVVTASISKNISNNFSLDYDAERQAITAMLKRIFETVN